MHRIDVPTATVDNKFTEGNPGTGVPATKVSADIMNAVQEEVVYVIEQAGIALNKADNTQLRAAIQKMITDSAKSISITAATFAVGVVDGDMVRWDSGASNFAKAVADSTANNRAVGVADVTNFKVYCYGETPALFVGLTPGSRYYLSGSVAGEVTTSAPADPIKVGIAKSDTVMFIDIDDQLGNRLPASLVGDKGKVIQVKSDESGYEHKGMLKRNVLINGDLGIWQATTSLTGKTTGDKTADTFAVGMTSSGTWTYDRSTDVPDVASIGRKLSYSHRVLCTTSDASVGSGDSAFIVCRIEGYDYATLYQQPQTVEFWVKSNKTGLYTAFVRNGVDLTYLQTFTINAIDTWEKKSFTITDVPVGGTWNFTNGIGAEVGIGFVAGTSIQGTSGQWNVGNLCGVSGQVNLADLNNNYLLLTGVALVAGHEASNVIIPSFCEQLDVCKRYYNKSYNLAVFAGALTDDGIERVVSSGATDRHQVRFRSMRAAPTITLYNVHDSGSGSWSAGGASRAVAADSVGESSFSASISGTAAGESVRGHWIADARL